MGVRFAATQRTTMLQEMAEKPLDVLVIGGGITGAGIAWDAVLRGLRVGLVEKQDFAAGTSSRSTKLIHGGLRYLKQGEIGLVREVGRERAIVYRNAPHVVHPEPMLLPVVKGGSLGRFSASFGVWLYDRLAGVKRAERRRVLSREEALAAEPLLPAERLKGAILYTEYRTDDARLTLEVLKAAAARGALAVNYAEAVDFLYEGGRVAGAVVCDRLSGETYAIRAKHVVNAAGPWVDRLREKDGSLTGKRLHLTKGVHLVVPHERFPVRQAVYFDVFDGRMVFAIPRDGKTYIGTTDTDYHGSLEHPEVTPEDRDYLLRAVNDMFPTVHLRPEDVESCWAGLRPLLHEEGKAPSELSRRDEIFVSPTGLITIAGGKLTGFRKMAERVVDLVCRRLGEEEGRRVGPCITDRVPLSGGDVGGPEGLSDAVRNGTREGVSRGLSPEEAEQLARRYGSNTPAVLAGIGRAREASARHNLPLGLALEVLYGVEAEMAVTPADVLIRRTGMLLFDRPRCEKVAEGVVRWMGELFGWSPQEADRYRQELEAELAHARRAGRTNRVSNG